MDVNLNMNNERGDLRGTDITSRDTHIDIENNSRNVRKDNDSFATYNSNSIPGSNPLNDFGQVNLRNVALDDPSNDVIEPMSSDNTMTNNKKRERDTKLKLDETRIT